MRVGVVGINHKLADLKLRELLAKVCQRRFKAGHSIHGEHTFILLSTCNRTEIYFASDNLPHTHGYILGILRTEIEDEFDQKLYSYFGVDCFCHLTRVAAGLDSAILAETEIQGQVKVAYEMAKEYACLPSHLHFTFQKALKIGKGIRSQLQLGRGMPDLEHAILQIGSHFFKTPQSARVLFVGVSEINQKILRFLKGKGFSDITICNRTRKNAEDLTRELQLYKLPWEQLSDWIQYDWVICGTRSPDYLILKEHLNTAQNRKLLIDLCVPRNIDPLLGKNGGVTLLNIDQINRTLSIRKKHMMHQLDQADILIKQETHKQVVLFQQKEIHRQHFIVA